MSGQKLTKWRVTNAYGFIVPDDGGPDIYLGKRAVDAFDRPVREGMRVTFETVPGRDGKGPQAVNLEAE